MFELKKIHLCRKTFKSIDRKYGRLRYLAEGRRRKKYLTWSRGGCMVSVTCQRTDKQNDNTDGGIYKKDSILSLNNLQNTVSLGIFNYSESFWGVIDMLLFILCFEAPFWTPKGFEVLRTLPWKPLSSFEWTTHMLSLFLPIHEIVRAASTILRPCLKYASKLLEFQF